MRQTAAASPLAGAAGGNIVESLQPPARFSFGEPSGNRRLPTVAVQQNASKSFPRLHRTRPASSAPNADCYSRRSWLNRCAHSWWSRGEQYPRVSRRPSKLFRITTSSGFATRESDGWYPDDGSSSRRPPADKTNIREAAIHPHCVGKPTGVFRRLDNAPPVFLSHRPRRGCFPTSRLAAARRVGVFRR